MVDTALKAVTKLGMPMTMTILMIMTECSFSLTREGTITNIGCWSVKNLSGHVGA